MRGTRIALIGAAAVALCLPAGAAARTIHVHPGNQAIQKAIAKAHGGDALAIHGGDYHGAVKVDKRLKLVGVDGRPRIRGHCGVNFVVRVRHNGVILKHLRVIGADEGHGSFPSEVDFRFVDSGKAKDLKVEDSCDAEYGINAYDTGPLELVENDGTGFEDAGIYIGGIQDTLGGTLTAADNEMYGNNRGIIVEDSNAPAVDIAVSNNNLHDNTLSGEGSPAGLFLTNSDGLLISGNVSNDNGVYGFQLANDADDNVFNDNSASGNGTAAFFAQAGSDGSCGTGNLPANFGLADCP